MPRRTLSHPGLTPWAVLALGAAWASLGAPPATAQTGVPLRDVAALAKVRAERQRPAQLAALEPFLADLRTDYRRNWEVLDKTIDKVAALGDAVFPVLVEQLTPADGDARSRYLAENTARVLARLAPKDHLSIWIELVDGDHGLGRRLGLQLLGATGDPRGVPALLRAFPTLSEPDHRLAALDAAEKLGTTALAPLVMPMLQASDADLRRRALQHLARTGCAEAVPMAFEALRNERENALLGTYIDFFAATVHADSDIADALTPLVEGVRLDAGDAERLVAALATIAPPDHKETRRVLTKMLDNGQMGTLGIQAALTLQAIGDKRGRKLLFDQLDERVKRSRSDADPYADRADAYLAFESHREAIRDYEKAIDYSRISTRRQYYYLQVARCEAHRGNSKSMTKALRDSDYSDEKIVREAAGDLVFLEQLKKAGIER